jgi:hypothetical protein
LSIGPRKNQAFVGFRGLTGNRGIAIPLETQSGAVARGTAVSIDKEEMMAKYGKKAQSKVRKAMHERKAGSLRSGSSGKKVKSRKQAIAIGLSEARREGGKVPARKSVKKSARKTTKKSTKKSAKKKPAKKSSTKKRATKKSAARKRSS